MKLGRGEEKVKCAVKTKLGIDIDIERAHRVERKHRQGKESYFVLDRLVIRDKPTA